MHWFSAASVVAAVLVVVAAGLMRGRLFAVFAGVLLSVHTLSSIALAPAFEWAFPLFCYLQVAVYLNIASLIRARMRPTWHRVLISVPASFFVAGSFLAIPWALTRAAGLELPGVWLPYVIALAGVLQSLSSRPEVIDISITGEAVTNMGRHPAGSGRVARPLKVVQITDPHLGPFMSEARLRRVCERAVARQPDLVVLTGDYLTMESSGDYQHLARALAPLAALPGRVVACRGNHDHEAPATVARALAEVGATLLVDDEVVLETEAGPVQVLGLDFHFRQRRERVLAACHAHPRIEGAFRLVLLHDPGAFKHIPDCDADLVLSGHTHGGQLGLLSLGLRHTVVSALSQVPDHGLWAQGENRLYVHRGTGHYGFPLRLGVPGEDSLLRVHDVRSA